MAIQKVLIVDDSKTELMFMTNLLQKNGMSVRTAEGADEALRRLSEVASSHSTSVRGIISDVRGRSSRLKTFCTIWCS